MYQTECHEDMNNNKNVNSNETDNDSSLLDHP